MDLERLKALLSEGRHNVAALAKRLRVSIPTVNRRLRALRDSGVPVQVARRSGAWALTLAPAPPARLPPRRPDSHKGDYGRVLVVAGSYGMAGAAALTCTAALRSGAGLVYLACPDRIADIMAVKLTEVVLRPQKSTREGTLAALDDLPCDALAVGPGLSRHPKTVRVVLDLLHRVKVPTVVDADALNALATDPFPLGSHVVLTPHAGEFARLTRRTSARQAARDLRCTLLLKGHRTQVTDGSRTAVNRTGNPGMATGGSGDVLTGIIAALLGQGLAPFEAAALGAHVHGLAGDLAARELGQVSLIASDLIAFLPKAFLAEQGSPRRRS